MANVSGGPLLTHYNSDPFGATATLRDVNGPPNKEIPMTRIALASLVLLSACDLGTFAPDRNTGGGFGFTESNTEGFLRGDFATVQGFDDDLALGTTQVGQDWTYMELHVEGPYGWAMLGLNLQGELGQGSLSPGNTVSVVGFNSDISTSEDGEVVDGDVIGCSGPDTWNAETDEPAQQATLSISENPDTGALEVDIVADFGDNGIVTGSGSVSPTVNPR